MNSKKSFRTLKNEPRSEFTEKKSVFISYAKSVQSEKDALDFIAQIREKNNNATHNCYAYEIRNGVVRVSDDGEPSSTAGMPILNIIQKNNITDVVIVVTRYFGGIMLGASGLIRAYSTAAKNVMDAAQIVEYTDFTEFTIRCGYSEYQKINKTFASENIVVDNTIYDDKITVAAAVKKEKYEEYKTLIVNISNGTAIFTITGSRYGIDK